MPTETPAKESKRMERFLSMFENGVPTVEDFSKVADMLVDYVKKMDMRLSGQVEQLATRLNQVADEIKQNNETSLAELKGGLDELFVGERIKGFEKKLNEARKQMENRIRRRMDMVKNGRDADEEKVALKVLTAMPMPFDPTELQKEVDENQKKIEKLEEEIEDIKGKRLGGVVGGGTSMIGVRYALGRIVTTETPSGAINGSNVTYTLTQPPQAILSFYINGMFIHPAEYTLSGGTITFVTALSADLSGTGFTCTYV